MSLDSLKVDKMTKGILVYEKNYFLFFLKYSHKGELIFSIFDLGIAKNENIDIKLIIMSRNEQHEYDWKINKKLQQVDAPIVEHEHTVVVNKETLFELKNTYNELQVGIIVYHIIDTDF